MLASGIVAVLMGAWTYLFAIYQDDKVFLAFNWVPFFLTTLWVPFACIAGIALIYYYFNVSNFKTENQIKKLTFISIFIFSMYFVAFSFFKFSPDYYVLAFTGFIFFFLSFLLRIIKKNCVFLTKVQVRVFYCLLFVYPLFVLALCDYYTFAKTGIVFYSLFFIVGYVPALLGLTGACLIKKHIFKDLDCKYLFSFDEMVFVLFFANLLTALYATMMLGSTIFYICLSSIIGWYMVNAGVRFFLRNKG